MFFWDKRTLRGGGGDGWWWGGAMNDLGGNCERLLLASACAPDTPQSLALPSPSLHLWYSPRSSFCYVTVEIGCAWGRAGGTGNGTSGRSKAREGRSKVKRHRFVLLQQVLTEVSHIEGCPIDLLAWLPVYTYTISFIYLFIFTLLTNKENKSMCCT